MLQQYPCFVAAATSFGATAVMLMHINTLCDMLTHFKNVATPSVHALLEWPPPVQESLLWRGHHASGWYGFAQHAVDRKFAFCM